MKAFQRETTEKLTTYFIEKLECRPAHTGWLRRGTCPSCEANLKFGVNLWLNRTNCFKCGYHPKPINLLMELENLSTMGEFYSFIGTFESTDVLDKPVELLQQKFGKLPESYKLIIFGDSHFGRLARKYMKSRGYDINELALKGVGYCTKGPYRGRIITPFYENGRIVYFNARKFIDVGEKHKNPSVSEFGVGKSLLIYNVDCLWLYNRTYLVESATNALTLGDRAFATGGKKLSNYQVSKIIKSPCKEVVVLLDKDAWWESLKLGLLLSPHKRVRLVEMPDERDVNDLGKKKTLRLIKKSKVLSYKEIYKLFINTEKPEHYLPTV